MSQQIFSQPCLSVSHQTQIEAVECQVNGGNAGIQAAAEAKKGNFTLGAALPSLRLVTQPPSH